jgi:hypothetical protein
MVVDVDPVVVEAAVLGEDDEQAVAATSEARTRIARRREGW